MAEADFLREVARQEREHAVGDPLVVGFLRVQREGAEVTDAELKSLSESVKSLRKYIVE